MNTNWKKKRVWWLALLLIIGVLSIFPLNHISKAEFSYNGTHKKIIWKFDPQTGVLDISGTGALVGADKEGVDYPWEGEWGTYITTVNIAEGITEIGWGVFNDCHNIVEINIPDSVKTIGAAFDDCMKLENIYISKNVTKINGFLGGENLKNIFVSAKNKNYSSKNGVLFNKEMTILEQYPSGNKRTTYKIPKGVKTIGASSFGCALFLKQVIIPKSVQTIESRAFCDARALIHVTIPGSVKSIKYGAFEDCINLQTVSFSKGLLKIGTYALQDVTGSFPSKSPKVFVVLVRGHLRGVRCYEMS